jgi:hypothetical protein
MPSHIIPSHVMPSHVMPRHVMPRHVTPHQESRHNGRFALQGHAFISFLSLSNVAAILAVTLSAIVVKIPLPVLEGTSTVTFS